MDSSWFRIIGLAIGLGLVLTFWIVAIGTVFHV